MHITLAWIALTIGTLLIIGWCALRFIRSLGVGLALFIFSSPHFRVPAIQSRGGIAMVPTSVLIAAERTPVSVLTTRLATRLHSEFYTRVGEKNVWPMQWHAWCWLMQLSGAQARHDSDPRAPARLGWMFRV